MKIIRNKRLASRPDMAQHPITLYPRILSWVLVFLLTIFLAPDSYAMTKAPISATQSGGQESLPATAGGAEKLKKSASLSETQTSIINADGNEIGTLKIVEGTEGVVITVDITGLPAGRHGMHFHDKGICNPESGFKDAGGHIMPDKKPHGFFHPQGPHDGNLPNLIVGENGAAHVELYSNMVMLQKAGEAGVLLDSDGASLIIHENPDDHFTQPIGGAGGRIACAALR